MTCAPGCLKRQGICCRVLRLTTNFEPVRSNLGQQVYQYLRAKILRVDIAPGSPLGIREMAEQLGVSRSPVRDAFLLLAAEGLIEPGRAGSFRVVRIDRKYIEDVFAIRIALELASIRLCVENQDPARVQQLCDTWSRLKMKSSGSVDNELLEMHITEDNNLHQSIAEMSGNKLMKYTLDMIVPKASQIRRWSYAGGVAESHLVTLAEEHLMIIGAMQRRDPDAAVAALDGHLRRARERSLSRLEAISGSSSADRRPRALKSDPR